MNTKKNYICVLSILSWMQISTESGLKVSKIWSKAGFSTCIFIENGRKTSFLFDCGSFDEATVSASAVFISHGHIDHIGSCVAHARARGLSHPPATYYVPEECVQHLTDAKYAFERLDDQEIAMNIVPYPVGQSIAIHKSYRVFSFQTTHRVASQGYGVVHIQEELMDQYKGFSPQEIRNIKLSGRPVTTVNETVEIVYTGDTIFESLLTPGLDFIFNCQILLIEMTYLDGEIDKALKWGHIHLDQFVNASHLFNNQNIVFLHISAKYHSYSRILTLLSEKVPPSIIDRCYAALASFGSSEFISAIRKDTIDMRSTSEVGWGWASRTSVNKDGAFASSVAPGQQSQLRQQSRQDGGRHGRVLSARRRSAPIRRFSSTEDIAVRTSRASDDT